MHSWNTLICGSKGGKYFNMQNTLVWKRSAHPFTLGSAGPACSILQCKYSNMVEYNGQNDSAESCISYSKIVVNKYKYYQIHPYKYILHFYYCNYNCRCKNALCKLNLLQYYEYIFSFCTYINKDFPPLTFEIANHKCTFFASIRNSSNIWTLLRRFSVITWF